MPAPATATPFVATVAVAKNQKGVLRGFPPKPTGGTKGKRSAQVRLKAHRRKIET